MDRDLLKLLAGLIITLGLCVLIVAGCQGLSTNTFRLEQTAVDLATGARAGWSNFYMLSTNGADAATLAKLNSEAAQVADARRKFAATIGTLENLRASYTTNSSLRPQVEAGLLAVNDNLSNLVWLVTYLKGSTNAF